MVNNAVLPIFRFVLNLAAPPVITVLFIRSVYDFDPWILSLIAILSIPLTFTVRTQWILFRDERAATAMGAMLAPTPDGKLPGNFDIIQKLQDQQFNGGYPGEFNGPFQFTNIFMSRDRSSTGGNSSIIGTYR